MSKDIEIHTPVFVYVCIHGVMFTLVKNGHGDPCSKPSQGILHFT